MCVLLMIFIYVKCWLKVPSWKWPASEVECGSWKTPGCCREPVNALIYIAFPSQMCLCFTRFECLVFKAFLPPQMLLRHSCIGMILSFKCYFFIYILNTHSRPRIVQEKNIALESECSWFWEVLKASLRADRCACAGQRFLYAPWSSSASLLALWRLPRKRAWQWGYQS